MGWFRANFVCFSAVWGLQGSTRAIYNAVFRWLSDLGELWRGSVRDFGVLSGSGCRLAVGGGCWVRQAVRRSGYIYVFLGILCYMLIFFNLSLIFSHILSNTLKYSHFIVFPHFSFINQSINLHISLYPADLPFLSVLCLLPLLLLLYPYQKHKNKSAVNHIKSGYSCAITALYRLIFCIGCNPTIV